MKGITTKQPSNLPQDDLGRVQPAWGGGRRVQCVAMRCNRCFSEGLKVEKQVFE